MHELSQILDGRIEPLIEALSMASEAEQLGE
jgi:hypothetical protein